MSTSHNVFVDGPWTPETLVAEITSLRPDLEVLPLGDGSRRFVGDDLAGDVGPHSYEADGELRFDTYPLLVDIWGPTHGAVGEAGRPADEVRDAFARRLVERLRALGQSRLLYAFDFKTRLDHFDPEP